MKRGAPVKLNRELIDKIKNFVGVAMTWEDIATVADVSRGTVLTWRKTAEKEMDRLAAGGEVDPDKQLYVEFLSATKKERLKSKYWCLGKIMAAGKRRQFWHACAWLLERQYPDEFALANRRELVQLREDVAKLKAMVEGK